MIRVLVSNIALPNSQIGSWTNRISRFLENHPDFFSFILSPNKELTKKHIYCKKRARIPLIPKRLHKWETFYFRAQLYLKEFKKIHQNHSQIQVLVIDDLMLLEAFALLKEKGYFFELVFSFHGHSFILPKSWGKFVDKVLFLTKSGYMDSFQKSEEFSPMVSIMGNGVDSNIFFPLSRSEKESRKLELGFSLNSKILVWMSNNRPKKGIHVFSELAKRLLKRYPELHILVIGAELNAAEFPGRIHSVGRIPNIELPRYLQAGDFYAFTSLWQEGFGLSLAEAVKCGNIAIASRVGGVSDVLNEVPSAVLVDQPNRIEVWEKAFDRAWKSLDQFNPDPIMLRRIHDLNSWEQNYISFLQ